MPIVLYFHQVIRFRKYLPVIGSLQSLRIESGSEPECGGGSEICASQEVASDRVVAGRDAPGVLGTCDLRAS